MVTCTGHIGIHEGADGRTDVDDVMAIKPNFLTSMGYLWVLGYHIFLTMVLRYYLLRLLVELIKPRCLKLVWPLRQWCALCLVHSRQQIGSYVRV